MKELSIEEKAQHYDAAINRANSLLSSNQLGNAWIYKLLPELRESNDEKIRKFLIQEVTETSDEIMSYRNMNKEDVLAWLEKQCEQKKSYDTCDSSMMDNKKSPYGEKRDFGYFEEKPDKVEPKFKVGDKIQYIKGHGTIMTIEKIENGEYILFGKNTGNTTIEGHTTIENGNKWYLVEQNPAWSEEK